MSRCSLEFMGTQPPPPWHSDQPLQWWQLDDVPHFHSSPILLLPAGAVGSLGGPPLLHGNHGEAEEGDKHCAPSCSHGAYQRGAADLGPSWSLWWNKMQWHFRQGETLQSLGRFCTSLGNLQVSIPEPGSQPSSFTGTT